MRETSQGHCLELGPKQLVFKPRPVIILEGIFILAQAEMGLGNLNVSEKLMKKVLEKYPDHQTAVAALPMIQEQLGRSDNTLSASWKRAQDADPNNQFANDYLSPKKSKKTKKSKTKKPIPTDIILQEVAVSPRLATFTLVHVLKEQGLYNRALDVLDILDFQILKELSSNVLFII